MWPISLFAIKQLILYIIGVVTGTERVNLDKPALDPDNQSDVFGKLNCVLKTLIAPPALSNQPGTKLVGRS